MGKNWSEKETKKAIKLFKGGNSYDKISKHIDRSSRAIQAKLNKLGYRASEVNNIWNKEYTCLECSSTFTDLKSAGRKFCSSKCSALYSNRNRDWEMDEDTKSKISQGLKRYVKENGKFGAQLDNESKKTGQMKNCPICREEFYVIPSKRQIYCSVKCFHQDKEFEYCKDLGGYRERGGTGKQGHYNGMYLHSSWELAYVLYCEDHGIDIERNTKGFNYSYKENNYKYYPDFIKPNNKYIEIKGYWTDRVKAKINQFPHEIDVIDKKDIGKYLEYVKDKYGANFINKYE